MTTEPIRTALAAFGNSGANFHAPFLRDHRGFMVTAVCERTRNRSDGFFRRATVVRTIDDLIDDVTIELVVVNTPDHTHGEITRRALRAGKHVVVEKPFVATSAEAQELLALAQRSGRTLTVYFNRRFDGDFRMLRDLVSHNTLGTIHEFESRFEFWRDPDDAAWREQPGPTAGALHNIGTHLLDQAYLLFGLPQSLFLTQRKLRPGSRIHDFFRLDLRYADCHVTLQSSYSAREECPRFRVRGTQATWTKYGLDGRPNGDRSTLHRGDDQNAAEEVSLGATDYGDFYDHLWRAIREGGTPPVSAEEAFANVRLVELAQTSERTGRWIDVAPVYDAL